MENKWLNYLSEQNNEKLIPIMEAYFSDNIDFEELNGKVFDLELLDFNQFKKDFYINEILGDN
jgi:hypothetical protein